MKPIDDNGEVRTWLKKHDCISPRKVERAAQLPFKTMNHYMTGRRKLRSEHAAAVVAVLKNYGYKPTQTKNQ